MQQYDHKRIEKKWQRVWKETGVYRTREPKKTTPTSEDGGTPFIKRDSSRQGLRIKDSKFYVLDMFPYPSGDGLHVGHPKGYIATDVYSRMKRMQRHSILHPMGWDAFGLPAENYAIQNKIHPAVAVKKNIKRFKKQLELLGFNYDWEREINTTDPNYYRWTQWIFLQMFHHGLAYRSNEPINWCPSCKTGLANEDLEDGRCERCGSVVEKRAIPQWVLRITDYADRLLSGLDKLDWPEYIKESQRNWIGRSEGSVITFALAQMNADTGDADTRRYKISENQRRNQRVSASVEVFTTRPDTLFGATYLVLAPEHRFVQEQIRNPKSEIRNKSEIQNYLREAKGKTEIERTAEGKEKTGVELKGITALNPANGEEIPVWIADYVLAEYGTGAIMAVPAHDERDFEFAKKHNLPIKMVVCPHYPAPTCPVLDEAYLGEGHLVDSGKFNGTSSEEAKRAIAEFVGGKIVTKYKLRDWVFSRQRYWGEPIPLVFCEQCKKQVEEARNEKRDARQIRKANVRSRLSALGSRLSVGEMLNPGWIGVPENKLPVKLPKVKSYEPTGTGESPLAAIESFAHTKCPKCGGPATRETNTMPQWAGSCWYYIAYCIRKNSKTQNPKSKQIPNLKSQSTKRKLQKWLPVDMYVGGAEHATRHLIYARFWHKFLYDIGVVGTDEPFQRLQNVGLILASDGRKMSKRYGNVLNPDEIVERFGADSLRVYEMFMGPFNQAICWSTDSLVGARRFLERVWRLHKRVSPSRIKDKGLRIEPLLHQTIKKVTEDIERFRFNTAVSSLMILLNASEKEERIASSDFETLLKLLAPFAPHLAEELWHRLGKWKSIHAESWPIYDVRLAEGSGVTIVAQVNGKTRGSFTAPRGERDERLREAALSLPAVAKWTVGKEITRVIVVKDRLVNIVV